jgi:hypothetical protein
MSQRIADASAKVARLFYPLPRMTDNVLSASLGQLTGPSGEVVQQSSVVKSISSSADHSFRTLQQLTRHSPKYGLGACTDGQLQKDILDVRFHCLR